MEEISTSGLTIMHGSSDLGMDELLAAITASNNAKNLVQVFDPAAIISEIHLISAYVNATAAFRNKTNISSKPYMEMLLFAALTRHINTAISTAGAKSSNDFVIFSNNKSSLKKLSSHIKMTKFVVSDKDFKQISIKLGLFGKDKKQIEKNLLMKIAASRLE